MANYLDGGIQAMPMTSKSLLESGDKVLAANTRDLQREVELQPRELPKSQLIRHKETGQVRPWNALIAAHAGEAWDSINLVDLPTEHPDYNYLAKMLNVPVGVSHSEQIANANEEFKLAEARKKVLDEQLAKLEAETKAAELKHQQLIAAMQKFEVQQQVTAQTEAAFESVDVATAAPTLDSLLASGVVTKKGPHYYEAAKPGSKAVASSRIAAEAWAKDYTGE